MVDKVKHQNAGNGFMHVILLVSMPVPTTDRLFHGQPASSRFPNPEPWNHRWVRFSRITRKYFPWKRRGSRMHGPEPGPWTCFTKN